ncbi:hypothetical protein GCM10010193_44650 [Kitasatospora atroaurantiaca]|uniref:Uncharacterized protein n=1 Tax=Kitasatospora atroaurantiaca TaxID=285545 RepID=A0A561F010_9ACTN|nr:DUF6247 family protein [Kitasatospora atroaurantiaca]TWE21152.1 hypothetical protein FB465_6319 [Kitasatospora atroaurantiaca]
MITQAIGPHAMPSLSDGSLAAIRATITAFAPRRLPELERERDQAFSQALETDSLGPVHLFLRRWREVAADERDLAIATRFLREDREDRDSEERHEVSIEIAAILLTAAAEAHRG